MNTYQNTVNGRAAEVLSTFESFNPATGEVIGLVAKSSLEEVDKAVSTAHSAQFEWAARPLS